MSPHYSDDELTLYYYGEARRPAAVEAHLDACAECAALYREISGTLAIVAAPEVPERGDQYGLEVWQRLRPRLPEPDDRRFSRFGAFDRVLAYMRWDVVALAGAAAVLVLAAFAAGRMWRTTEPTTTAVNAGTAATPAGTPGVAASEDDPARQRILLTAVADHLDRSERVLTDIMNAPSSAGGGHDDISAEQRWADDLITTSRLYRQDAIDAGEQSVAGVLDELERTLLEIVHSPSKITAADLEQIRRRIDAAALLFKVRVMGDELRRREATPADRASSRTSTSKVS